MGYEPNNLSPEGEGCVCGNAVIALKDVSKTYRLEGVEVHALRKTSLEIAPGEFVAIMGASGSGKSTLMNIIGCLTRTDGGEYRLDGSPVAALKPSQLAEVRNRKIGFVFQGFNLLPRTSALENVELPILYDRRGNAPEPRRAAGEALKRVGLGDRMHHEPNQLSGGQQQRVAIARALVNSPSIVLADEPTGNLDSLSSMDVMALFQELNGQGITVVLVTHENDIAQYAKRVIRLKDGRIVSDETVAGRRDAAMDAAEASARSGGSNGE